MAHSDAEYDFISPFALPAQTGNNNDVPESSLSSRIHTITFDGDDDSCIFITETPIDDADLDPYEDSDSDFGSPSSLPRIMFIGRVRANAAGVPVTVPGSPGPHRPDGFDWSRPSRYAYEAYEEDAISSASPTVASSPELTAAFDGRDSSSSTTSASASASRVWAVCSQDPAGGCDAMTLVRDDPSYFTGAGLLSAAHSTHSALYREIAVGESAFSRGARGRRRLADPSPSRAQEESDRGYMAFPDSIERPHDILDDRVLQQAARLGIVVRPARSPRADSAVEVDATGRPATRLSPARYPTPSRSLWGYTPLPPPYHGVPRPRWP